MKTIKKQFLIFAVLCSFIACDSLLGDNENEFSCDKNATIKINDKEHCAGAGSLVKAGRLQIGFSYATGGLDLLINEKKFKEGVTYTYAKGEVSIWFNNLNKVNSGLFLITKLLAD